LRQLIPARVKEVQIDSMLATESLEALEAVLLFHPLPAAP
jgi:hypothetical protein